MTQFFLLRICWVSLAFSFCLALSLFSLCHGNASAARHDLAVSIYRRLARHAAEEKRRRWIAPFEGMYAPPLYQNTSSFSI